MAYPDKLRECSDFQENQQQQGPIEGGGGWQGLRKIVKKINIKLEIVRFRGIFVVKRRYEILAEMSVFK